MWSLLLIKYFSGDQIKENEMDGARDKCEKEERNTYGIWCGGNRARGRPRNRWEWKIKMCRREIE